MLYVNNTFILTRYLYPNVPHGPGKQFHSTLIMSNMVTVAMFLMATELLILTLLSEHYLFRQVPPSGIKSKMIIRKDYLDMIFMHLLNRKRQ